MQRVHFMNMKHTTQQASTLCLQHESPSSPFCSCMCEREKGSFVVLLLLLQPARHVAVLM